jgi:rod shape-determining protein MreD
LAIIVATLLAAIQTALLPHFPVMGHTIDLVLLVVIARSILNRQRDGLFWAIGGGLALDLFSLAPFGANTLAMGIVAMFASIRGRDIQHAWSFYPLVAGLIGTLIFDLVVITIMMVMRRDLGLLAPALAITIPRSLINGIAMAPVFFFVSKFSPRERTAEAR